MTKFYSILSVLVFSIVALSTTTPADAANKADKALKKTQAAQLKKKRQQYKEVDRPQLNTNIKSASRAVKNATKTLGIRKQEFRQAQAAEQKFFNLRNKSRSALVKQKQRAEKAIETAKRNPTPKNVRRATDMIERHENAINQYRSGPRKRWADAQDNLRSAGANLNQAVADRNTQIGNLAAATKAKLAAKKKSRMVDGPNAQEPQQNVEYGVLPRFKTIQGYDRVGAPADPPSTGSSGLRPLYDRVPPLQNEYDQVSAAPQ